MYVVTGRNVVPIATATNTAGKPITIGDWPEDIVISPNGREAYVLCRGLQDRGVWHGMVTPISTRTNKPGRFIPAGHYPIALAVSGDSKTPLRGDYPSNTVNPGQHQDQPGRQPDPVAWHPYFVLGAP